MAGPTVTATLSVEFVPGSGTYVDVSSRVRSVRVDRPRSNPAVGIDASPTTLTAVIDNAPDASGFSPYTPGSPAAANYPHVTRDRRVKLTVTASAVTYTRFWGWSDRWVPDASDGEAGSSTVTLTASCVLSRYARRRSLSLFGEVVTSTPGFPGQEYYPFNEPTDSDTVQGYSSDGVAVTPGKIIVPNRPPGSATFAAPSGGHLTDGEIEFSRGDDNAPAPVVLLTLRPGSLIRMFQASFKLSTDPAGSLGDDMVSGYDASGNRLWVWSVKLVAGLVTWSLYDDAGVSKTFYATGAPRDDAWHYWEVSFLPLGSGAALTEKGGMGQAFGSFAWTYDPRPCAYLVLGGQMPPFRKGKQSNTFQGGISSFLVQYTTSTASNFSEFAVPLDITDAGRALAFVAISNIPLDTAAGGAHGSIGVGTDDTPIAYTNETDNQLDRWNEHVRTVGGMLSTRPNGRRDYRRAADARPTIPALVLDAAADLDMGSGGWQQTLDERPTRVSASSPVGSVVVVDDATETLTGLRLDGPSLSLSAGNVSVAQSAAAVVMAGRGDRLSQFGVDATLTATDKTADLFALKPGDRVRIQNLPSALMGVTYKDVYASGWSETYIGESGSAEFVFDTDPADDPPEGIFDDAEYGRFAVGDDAATVTGGTCVGTTGAGTLIVTSTSPITNSGAQFPMDLDWNGERVTVSGVGGATSPQTFTVTARGVAPSVARVHIAGEPLDIYHALTFTF